MADPLFGTEGNDTLTGDAAANLLSGSSGDDTIYGQSGDDLRGKNGNDTLSGGDGVDTISYEESNEGVVVDLGDGVSPGTATGSGIGTDLLIGFEHATGSDGDDVLIGDATNNTLDGGWLGSDVLVGAAGDDVLEGYNGIDTLDGGDGNDVLDGGDGNSTLLGGAGDDTLLGGYGNDSMFGGAGADFLSAGSLSDFLVAGEGDDFAEGGNANDTIFGGDGADLLWGNYGDDLIHGGDQNDTLGGESGADQLFGDNGDDTLTGGTGDDILDGGGGSDHLNGENGADCLDGGADADVVDGGANNDSLFGGGGNDVLYGGDGADVLHGDAAWLGLRFVAYQPLFPEVTELVDIGQLPAPAGDALGIDGNYLSLYHDTIARLTLVGGTAGYSNSVGLYTIASDGTIGDVTFAFENVLALDSGDTATTSLPGGPGSDLGLFLIVRSARLNDGYQGLDLESGTLAFVYDLGGAGERAAKITDAGADVSLVFDDGANQTVLRGPVIHSTERGGSTVMNTDGKVYVVSGRASAEDDTTLRIGFEDTPGGGDSDFNDVLIDVEIVPGTLSANDTLDGGAGDNNLTPNFNSTI